MLGAEADALSVVVTQAVAGFFNFNRTWLGPTISDAQRSGQFSSAQQAKALAELRLSTLQGAMVVGRGMRGGGGPAVVGKTLLRSLAG